MRFDYYLFDLDNSLLYIPNYLDHFDEVLEESLKRFSLPKIPNREQRNQLWSAGEEYIALLKKWGVVNSDDFWRYFDEIDFLKRQKLIRNKNMYFFKDVLDVLKRLRDNDKKLAIISNTADYIIEFIMKEFSLNDYFHEIFGLGENKDQELAKPNPEGILSVLKKLNFRPKRSTAIMIGDSIVDIFAAKRANINACLIRRDKNKYADGFEDWEYQPDFVIDKLPEIFEL